MLLGSENLRDSGAFPCNVCRKGVGVNSVFCSTCSHWVHKRCSGLTGRLKDQAYVCPRCLNLAPPLDYRPIKEVIVGNTTMDVEPKFCCCVQVEVVNWQLSPGVQLPGVNLKNCCPY